MASRKCLSLPASNNVASSRSTLPLGAMTTRSGFAGPAAGFGCFFGSSGLRVFGSSGLRVFGSSGLRVFGSSGLRVFGLMAVASLALAGCGGGDSTVQVPYTPPTPPPDCTAVPQPAGCPPPKPNCTEVPRPDGCPPPKPPKPLDGLSPAAKALAANSVSMGAITRPLTLEDNEHDKGAQQYTKPITRVVGNQVLRRSPDTRVALLTEVSGDESDPDYKFQLWTSGYFAGTSADSAIVRDYIPRALHESHTLNSVPVAGYAFFSVGMDAEGMDTIERLDNKKIPRYQYKKTKLDLGFGDDWDSSLLKAEVNSKQDGEKDAMLHAEVWSSYPGGKSDYLAGGVWLMVPNDLAVDAFHSGAFAHGNTPYGDMGHAVSGEATYNGVALGLHTSRQQDSLTVSRLTGKVTLTVDFGTTATTTNSNAHTRALISGRINSLTLDGESVSGQIILPQGSSFGSSDIRPLTSSNGRSAATNHNLGNIKGINYQGSWGGVFTGPSAGNAQPTGIAGTVGGSGGGNSFVASFGAKKVEAETQ